ncbi:MAG: lipid-A-disaccharide synthase, partial [Verrucomicrobiales bacterium]|nr:lipid-A-disaccharide synthase [Verrucomicrobiales bacterium]
LVDYPGFNLRLAQRLRDGGYQGRLIYYISPQVWAWKKGRVKVMARLLDLMICIFPFEKELYENSGLPTVFAGHPLVDRVAEERGQIARESDLVAFFPGSRANEVRRLLPTLLEAAQLLRQRVPGLRVALSAVSERRAEEMRELVRAAGVAEAVEWIEVGTAGELMQRASVGAVASGTATLEAACFGLPHALVYRVARPTYWVGKLVVRIRFLGILNILAGRQVVTELVQADFTPERVAEVLERLLRDEAARHEAQEAMQRTVAQLGAGGAYPNAAAAVLATLDAADPAVDLGKSSASMRK